MTSDEIFSVIRTHFDHHKFPGLKAATVSFDSVKRHLRVDFYFGGTSEEVDFAELEVGLLGELIAHIWASVHTVGFGVFFDEPSMKRALSDPFRLYPR